MNVSELLEGIHNEDKKVLPAIERVIPQIEKLVLEIVLQVKKGGMIQLGRVKGNKMVNMQLTNEKLVIRGTQMIMDELAYPETKAKRLLLLHVSVQNVFNAIRIS